MNSKALSFINPLLYLFDFFVGLHLIIGFWGDFFLNGNSSVLIPAVTITAGLIALNVFVYKLNKKVKLNTATTL